MKHENTLRLGHILGLGFHGAKIADFPFPEEILKDTDSGIGLTFGLGIVSLNDHHMKLVTPYRDSVQYDSRLIQQGDEERLMLDWVPTERETWIGVANKAERYDLGVLVTDTAPGNGLDGKKLKLRGLNLLWKMANSKPVPTFRMMAEGPELVLQMARVYARPELRIHFLDTLQAMRHSDLFDNGSLALLDAIYASAALQPSHEYDMLATMPALSE